MAITNNFGANLLALINDITSAETALISNAYYTKNFEDSDFATNHTILPGVRNGNIIPILSNPP